MHPTGEKVPLTTDNLLLRECIVKNTDFIEGIVVYAGKMGTTIIIIIIIKFDFQCEKFFFLFSPLGHETKALLNNGGPRYKRSGIERQMNRDIIW